MLETLRGISLIAATVTTGLTAGFLFAFAHDIMPGLRRTDDRTFVAAFQAVDKAVMNPWFLFCFMGALGFTALAAALHIDGDRGSILAWVVVALILYAATIGITGRINVPLNKELQAAGPADGIGDLAGVRARFEDTWVRWNVVRTVTSIASFGCLCWALVLFGRS